MSFDHPVQMADDFKPTNQMNTYVPKFSGGRSLSLGKGMSWQWPVELKNPSLITIDGREKKNNPYILYRDKSDDGNFGRSLKNSDIDGAFPSKFKHKPRKYFIDRQEIKSSF